MKKILIGMAAILCAACSSKDLYDEAKVEEFRRNTPMLTSIRVGITVIRTPLSACLL